MKTQDAITYFGSQEALAKRLGISQAAVSFWGEFPPPSRQLQIQRVTRRKLFAEPDSMDRITHKPQEKK